MSPEGPCSMDQPRLQPGLVCWCGPEIKRLVVPTNRVDDSLKLAAGRCYVLQYDLRLSGRPIQPMASSGFACIVMVMIALMSTRLRFLRRA